MMKYDLIVCGGGPAGAAAALAAASGGLRTALVERFGCLGGMASAGLVNPLLGLELNRPGEARSRFLGTPAFGALLRTLRRDGAYGTRLTPAAFDEEQLKIRLDELLSAAGVDLLFHTMLLDVVRDGGALSGVRVLGKEGVTTLNAALFIDSTGDGDLAAAAGCPFDTGRPGDGLMQPGTMSFRMGGVDKSELSEQSDIRAARALVDAYFQQACRSGALEYPYRDFIHFYDYPRPGVLHFNMTRINGIDGCSSRGLARGETEGRRQVKIITDWLVREVPCFRNAFLEKLPQQVGIRETRHFRGEYAMERGDIVSGRKFADGIARSAYFIDIHSPVGSGFDHSQQGTKGAVLEAYKPPAGDYYEIPFRSLRLPGADNLLVACRALSASHVAAAAIRVMSPMFAVGEAAGCAAVLARRKNGSFAEVDGEAVRRALGYLDREPEAL